MKKFFKIFLIIILALVIIVGGYVAYVFIAYHRIGDQSIDVQISGMVDEKPMENDGYSIVSYNIGFGAYEADYDFFMDGGTQSWAWSKERLDVNLNTISSFLNEQKADFYLVQEVDIDSTRTYHFDEREYIVSALTPYYYTFAQNYDSPFLMYPVTQPHGASESGLLTFSTLKITSASRVELPIESGFMKLLDLDRCYSKQRIALDDGRELILYNFHLSAYTSDGKIATEQLKLILSDMQKEYDSGNYCIAGGDFNKDILGDSSVYFGKSDKEYTWAQPLPDGIFDEYSISVVAPLDEENPVPSCRNADSAYHEGQYVLTIDGFMVSDNIEVKESEVIDTGFAYSDHNPVKMTFEFK